MVKWMQGTFNQALKNHGPREDGLPLGVIKHRYNFMITNAIVLVCCAEKRLQ